MRVKERLHFLCLIFYYSRFISKLIEYKEPFISVGMTLQRALSEAKQSSSSIVILSVKVVDTAVTTLPSMDCPFGMAL